MDSIEGVEVYTQDLVTDEVHRRLRMDDGRYAVFHPIGSNNAFVEVDQKAVPDALRCKRCFWPSR